MKLTNRQQLPFLNRTKGSQYLVPFSSQFAQILATNDMKDYRFLGQPNFVDITVFAKCLAILRQFQHQRRFHHSWHWTQFFQESWQRKLVTGPLPQNADEDWNQFFWLRKQLVNATRVFGKKQIWTSFKWEIFGKKSGNTIHTIWKKIKDLNSRNQQTRVTKLLFSRFKNIFLDSSYCYSSRCKRQQKSLTKWPKNDFFAESYFTLTTLCTVYYVTKIFLNHIKCFQKLIH